MDGGVTKSCLVTPKTIQCLHDLLKMLKKVHKILTRSWLVMVGASNIVDFNTN